MNTENTDSDSSIKFIREKFKVKFVPTLMYIKNGVEYSRITDEENIQKFLDDYN